MQPVTVTPLDIGALTAALLVAGGALAVAWRTLAHNDRLRIKLDWLRSTNETLKSELKSYESATPADRKRTTLMPASSAGALQRKTKV